MSERLILINRIKSIVVLISLILIGYWYLFVHSDFKITEKITSIEVVNRSNDTIVVFLTLNQSDGYINDVNGILGINSTNKKQGEFILLPREKRTYTPPIGLAFSGNISFIQPPLNCPYIGTTLYEFTLNNEIIAKNSQETVDISCVAGVNSLGEINLINSGSDWTDNINEHPIIVIKNHELYENTNVSGVFPYGCTSCTDTFGAPNCTDSPEYSIPNLKNICNVQRNAKNSGGFICISYLLKP